MTKELFEILTGFKRSLALMDKDEKSHLAFATSLMMITGILTNLPAIILGKFVDRIVNTKLFSFQIAIPFIVTILVVVIVREAITVIRKYLVENVATQTEKKQTTAVINQLLQTDITSFINKQQIGSLHGRIFRSIQGLVRVVKLGFLDFFPTLFSALAAIAIAFYQKPPLASVMILVIPVGLLIVIKQISSQKGIRVALLRGKEQIDGTVVEMLSGIETVRVLNTSRYEVEKIETIAEDLRKKEIKHHIAMALFDAIKYLNEGFFYIVVISLSVFFSATGVITKGDILVYSILFISITNPLREIHRILDEAHESSIKVNDLYSLLHQPLDISFTQSKITTKKGSSRKEFIIDIKNVFFAYSLRPNVTILNNMTLIVKKGEKIGIAGPSGCGKSTLVKLLLRLLHGYEGEISIFGQNLTTISREMIAQKIAYIPQKPYVFSGTINENILYGLKDRSVNLDQIIEAAKKAHIYDEIMNSLGGFQGNVAEGGNNLSGGQKQRLVIARLILQSPEILIFDEATAALDNKNEILIQKSIEELFKDKTIITIAHRLTTLKNSDRILVFDKGEIIQEGSYETLSKIQGLFRDFLEQEEDRSLIPAK